MSLPSPAISIVLATYNGELYLQDQLESLLAQSWRDFELVVTDDGSTDRTMDIVRSYIGSMRISLHSSEGRLGAVGNFQRGVLRSTGKYVAFCDQDDVWLARRLEESMKLMLELEGAHGGDEPILVHSDLRVVDKNLNLIAPSLYRLNGFNPATHPFERLLMQNVVTGSTCLMNRPLVDLAFPIPGEAFMHDWWVALVAKAAGRIGYIDHATVLYRQHAANVIGAVRRGKSPLELMRKLVSRSFSNKRYQQALLGRTRQARALQRRLGGQLPESTSHQLTLFSELLEQSFLRKRVTILSNGFRRGNIRQDLEMLLRI